MAFSRAGDQLSLRPGEALSLTIEGPTAPAAGAVDDNLVLRAAREFRLALSRRRGSALSTSSSDCRSRRELAAAPPTPRRRCGCWRAPMAYRLDDQRLIEAARKTGADVPVCLAARARMMRGLGEELGPLLELPPLVALIVNPGVPLETKAVFARMGHRARRGDRLSRPSGALAGHGARGADRRFKQRPQRHGGGGLPSRADHRRCAGGSFRRARAAGSRACRARARPALPCSRIANPPRGRERRSCARTPAGGSRAAC